MKLSNLRGSTKLTSVGSICNALTGDVYIYPKIWTLSSVRCALGPWVVV